MDGSAVGSTTLPAMPNGYLSTSEIARDTTHRHAVHETSNPAITECRCPLDNCFV